jgi:DNA-binding transcriptional LysR family regulator
MSRPTLPSASTPPVSIASAGPGGSTGNTTVAAASGSRPPPDALDLDGHLLQLLLAVVEEGAITAAAQRLGVSQSAVSHLLDKLRAIVADPLFVKSGRGIVPTARATALAAQARDILDSLRRFAADSPHFDPALAQGQLVVAANDLQNHLLLPRLLRRLRAVAPRLTLRVIPSGVPSAALLREERCQLIISPRPPEASDVLHKRLFTDRYRIFYDETVRDAPLGLQAYQAAEHLTVLYEPRRMLDVDEWLLARGIQRQLVVLVPGFSGIAPFLRGSPLLATLPSLLGVELLRGFAQVELPITGPDMPMYMIWHLRHQHDPLHSWVRSELETVARELGRE